MNLITIIFLIISIAGIASTGYLYFLNSKKKKQIVAKENEIKEISNEAVKVSLEARAKTDFLANTSREIRTPMNAISCAIELLQKEELPDTAKTYISILRASSDTMMSTVDDIMDFSKLDTGKMQLCEEEYDVRKVTEAIIEEVVQRLVEKPIALIVNIDPTLPRKLIGDKTRVSQVILNMLTNAAKFTTSGKIEVNITYERLSKDVIDVKVSVADTGCGIPPQQKNELKERFKTSETIIASFSDTTSLGLAIAKQLTLMMAGDLTFESELSKGTTFTAKFRQKINLSDVNATESKVNRNFAIDVLVWEDNPYYKESLVTNFKNIGIPARVAETADDVRGILSSVKTDFAFTTKQHVDELKDIISMTSPTTTIIVMFEIGDKIDFSLPGYHKLMKPITLYMLLDIIDQNSQYNKEILKTLGKLKASDAKVLLVDDNRVNLKVGKALFETFDINVSAVDSGFEAVELFRTGNHFDIIFLDHMMPGMDGVETAKQIRKIEGNEETPIIALSANAGAEVERMFFEEGLNDFIPKPIRINHLTYILEKWLPKDKQQYIDDGSIKKNKNTLDSFEPEEGIKKNFNDEKIYETALHVYKENSPELLNNFYNEETGLFDEGTARELNALSNAIGAAYISELVREFINVAVISDSDTLHDKYVKICEEQKIVINKINEYLTERQEDILTFA